MAATYLYMCEAISVCMYLLCCLVFMFRETVYVLGRKDKFEKSILTIKSYLNPKDVSKSLSLHAEEQFAPLKHMNIV